MLARSLGWHAALLLALVPLSLGWASPRQELALSTQTTLEDFTGWSAKAFRVWCDDRRLVPAYYPTPTGAPVNTDPELNIIQENHSGSLPGSTVSDGDTVGVVFELTPVEDFGGATVGFFRGWCRDYGMLSRFKRSGGGNIANPGNHWFILRNETNDVEVPVGGTVGVVLSGPYLTIKLAYWFAAIVLIAAIVISVAISRGIARRAER